MKMDDLPKTIPGIDINTDAQLKLLDEFEKFYKDIPFTDEKEGELRYYYKNDQYPYSDAIF